LTGREPTAWSKGQAKDLATANDKFSRRDNTTLHVRTTATPDDIQTKNIRTWEYRHRQGMCSSQWFDLELMRYKAEINPHDTQNIIEVLK